MIKEVTVGFKGQSKSIVEEVKIKYIFSDEDMISKNFIKDEEILKEVKQLQLQAGAHARAQSMYK